MPPETMKGLKKFMMDLRNCKSKEAETQRCNKELANIRKRFKGDTKVMDGYQKRKYVCKLVYIYLLGYDIDFGHVEAITLLASSKYSEKSVGYLFVSVLLNENSDLVRLLIQSIKNDLVARNETHCCLALTCIANIGGEEMAETLGGEVQKLLVSGDSSSYVKKKAALALLHLYRKAPAVLPEGEWRHRVINLLDERDLGVVTAVLDLLYGIVPDHRQAYQACLGKAVELLRRILKGEAALDDYYYYQVPAPWLQVQILRLVQMYPPPEDTATRKDLVECLRRILANSALVKGPQTNNARQAVLYEAINVAVHLESEVELVISAANLLGQCICAKETNTRYMALSTLCHLCAISYASDHVNQHLNTILQALKFEKDISVRRAALDLLFAMCNPDNAKVIITALIGFLQHAEYAIREEMVIKTAVLAERCTTDYALYVDVILSLIKAAGGYVSEEVWHRVVQIITNHEEVQEYAAQTCFDALEGAACHETMIKVGGYVLGEFGDLIASKPASSPQQQLSVLKAKLGTVSADTKGMLLAALVKLANLFPELRPAVIEIMRSRQIARNTNAELQQRGMEYLNLLLCNDDNTVMAVLDQLPPFPEKSQTLLSKAMTGEGAAETDRTANTAAHADSAVQFDIVSAGGNLIEPMIDTSRAQHHANTDLTASLASLSLSPATPTPGTEKWLLQMVCASHGVLFEDSCLQIGAKDEYKGNLGVLALYYSNKTSQPMTDIKTSVSAEHLKNQLRVEAKGGPMALQGGSQQHHVIQCEALDIFDGKPMLDFVYTLGGKTCRVTLALPVFVSKFFQPFSMTREHFAQRWAQLTSPGLEEQVIFQASRPMESTFVRSKINGLNMALLDGIDPNVNNLVASGVIHTARGQTGCMLRLEPNQSTQMWRMTFRTAKPNLGRQLADLLKPQL